MDDLVGAISRAMQRADQAAAVVEYLSTKSRNIVNSLEGCTGNSLVVNIDQTTQFIASEEMDQNPLTEQSGTDCVIVNIEATKQDQAAIRCRLPTPCGRLSLMSLVMLRHGSLPAYQRSNGSLWIR